MALDLNPKPHAITCACCQKWFGMSEYRMPNSIGDEQFCLKCWNTHAKDEADPEFVAQLAELSEQERKNVRGAIRRLRCMEYGEGEAWVLHAALPDLLFKANPLLERLRSRGPVSYDGGKSLSSPIVYEREDEP